MHFSSTVALEPPRAHLTVAGELDVSSSRAVRRAFDGALVDGGTDLTGDASGVTFVAAAGLGAFVWLRNAALAQHGRVRFVAVSDPFARVCEMAGLGPAFGLDPRTVVHTLS